jgi:anti-sigma regulatory factor (Ser/Thr protein kinase)
MHIFSPRITRLSGCEVTVAASSTSRRGPSVPGGARHQDELRGGGCEEGAVGTFAQRAALTQIVGKTITGIVMAEGASFPKSQLFLTFSDNTYYELYCVYDEIEGTNHLCTGGIDEVKASTADRSIAHEIVDTVMPRPAFARIAPDDAWPIELYDERLGPLRLLGTLPPPRAAGAPDPGSLAPWSSPASWPEPAQPETVAAPQAHQAGDGLTLPPSTQAGKVMHDVNNALGTIVGYSDLLSATLPPTLADQPEIGEYLGLIRLASLDAADVIQRYRDANQGRPGLPTRSSVCLDEVVQQTISLTRLRWHVEGSGDSVDAGAIQVHTELGDVPPIAGDPVELREALSNLIYNAVDAVGRTGTITVHCYRDADTAVVEVHDTGVGMREDVRRRATEAHFTTRWGNGNGLGLTIVSEIVARHAGTLQIASRPGAGTTVTLRFPLADEPL